MDSIFSATDWDIGILVAAALAMVTLASKELQAARILIFVGAAITIVRWILWSFTCGQPWWIRATVGAIIGALLLAGLPAILSWVKYRNEALSNSPTEERKPLTMRQIFDSDFPGFGKTFMSFNLPGSPNVEQFAGTEFWSIPTNSYFLAIYLDKCDDPEGTLRIIAIQVPNILQLFGKISFQVTTPGDSRLVSNSSMVFSREIYIYLTNDLSLAQMANLENFYLSLGYTVHFRGTSYLVLHWKEFDRLPRGVDETGTPGVQLPEVAIGTEVKIINGLGPPATNPEALPLPSVGPSSKP